MWDPLRPDDFSRFRPADMIPFLSWWEGQSRNGLQFRLADLFVEGLADPYLQVIASGGSLPQWVDLMLRWRSAAAWTYEQGVDLSVRLKAGIPGLVIPGSEGIYQEMFAFTPEDLAAVPPSVLRAFDRGSQFSLAWVKKLSNEARADMQALLAVNTLKNRNPKAAVPILEQVLRRDRLAERLGIPVDEVTPEQVQAWLSEATQKELLMLARRAELIAVTEGSRMQNAGILAAMAVEGEGHAFVMPHAGSCPECRRLVDGRAFRIETLEQNLFANFGVKKTDWKPALPQHPRCRHSPAKIPYRFRKALKRIRVPDDGILLEWYGLSGEAAMQSLGFEKDPGWLVP